MGIRQATPFHKNLIVTEIVEATLTVVCLWPYTLQRTLMDQWTDGWMDGDRDGARVLSPPSNL